MRKGGFNMYLMKEKSSTSLYRGYTPKFSNHQDVEIRAYVANTVGNDIAKHMKVTIRCMSGMIVRGFSRRNK